MAESYYPDYPDSPDQQLDELLCEYVDGTMDPTVRAAFEEYLEANPDLARHVHCLFQTRTILCSYGCRHPKESLQDQIRRRVVGELDRQNRADTVLAHRLDNAAMLTSSISLLLIVGMMIGLSVVNEPGSEKISLVAAAAQQESMELPSDAYGRHMENARPLESLSNYSQQSLLGPSAVLPVIDMPHIGWHEMGTMHPEAAFVSITSP